MVDTNQLLLGAALIGVGAVAARAFSSPSTPSTTEPVSSNDYGTARSKPSKNKKKKRPAATNGLDASTSADTSRAPTPLPAPPPVSPPPTIEVTPATTPGKSKKAKKQDAKSEPKPLAERRLPKAPKTGVEDMLEEQPDTKPARVIKVVDKPRAPSPPPANAYVAPTTDRDEDQWEQYDHLDDDGGWEAVESKSNRNKSAASSIKASEPTAAAAPARAIPGLPAGTASANAKKNAKKAQAAADAKAEAERDRIQRLAAHRAGRAAEDDKARAAAARPKPTSVPAAQTTAPKSSDDYWTQDPKVGSSRQPTSKASVDADTGSLIWS